jgi:hypothetical protein
MKKLLAFVLVLGLASLASAALVPGSFGVIPVFSDPTGPGTSPDNPLEESDIIYIDLIGVSNYNIPMAVNSTGQINLSLGLTAGGAEFIGNADYTYYPEFEYREAEGGFGGAPEWLGWNDMVVESADKMYIGGGLPPGEISAGVLWPVGDEMAMLFDHIGIHCLGKGDVELVVAPSTVAAPLGRPSVATPDSDFTLEIDTQAIGGSLIIYQVPEPMTMALLGLGGLALLRRRR